MRNPFRKLAQVALLSLAVSIVAPTTAFCFDRFLDNQLYSAAENGTMPLMKVLLLVGGDANAKNAEGITPLMGAASNGKEEAVKLLLDKGADPKAATTKGETALTMGYHHLSIVKMLVEKGADLNAQPTFNGKKTMTALMSATMDGNKDVVAYLLEKGADPMIKTTSEKSALDMAKQRGLAEIVSMLDAVIQKKMAAAGATPGAPGTPGAADPNAAPAQPGTAPGAPGTAPAAAAAVPGGAAPAAAAAPAPTTPAGQVPASVPAAAPAAAAPGTAAPAPAAAGTH